MKEEYNVVQFSKVFLHCSYIISIPENVQNVYKIGLLNNKEIYTSPILYDTLFEKLRLISCLKH